MRRWRFRLMSVVQIRTALGIVTKRENAKICTELRMKISIFLTFVLLLAFALSSVVETHNAKWICCTETRVEADMRTLVVCLIRYRAMTGCYPSEEQRLGALVQGGVVDGKVWQIMEALPKDPWGRPYQYRAKPQSHRGYVLFSLGKYPDDAKDDVVLPEFVNE